MKKKNPPASAEKEEEISRIPLYEMDHAAAGREEKRAVAMRRRDTPPCSAGGGCKR
jgi:hypothetical protein